ncbi:hypothetical protein ACP70R_030060 [Stipagrostis hirtigluma subsp. patula]
MPGFSVLGFWCFLLLYGNREEVGWFWFLHGNSSEVGGGNNVGKFSGKATLKVMCLDGDGEAETSLPPLNK